MVVRKPSDVEKVLIGTSEEEIVPVKSEASVVPSAQKVTSEAAAGQERDGVVVGAQQPDNKVIEDAEEAVEEIGQEVSEGDSKDEDGEITKENFSKNPTQNNNNNVKKTFNRESAKRKISIPLHMQNMEQEKVVDPLPVMEQIEVEDDASRKSSLASTQWSWPSDHEDRPAIIPLKKSSAPAAGLSVGPVRSVRVSTVVPARVDDPNAVKQGKFTKIPHKNL